MSAAALVATLGAPPPEEADAWEAAKSSALVDTLVEAAVVVCVGAAAQAVLAALTGLRALPACVR